MLVARAFVFFLHKYRLLQKGKPKGIDSGGRFEQLLFYDFFDFMVTPRVTPFRFRISVLLHLYT